MEILENEISEMEQKVWTWWQINKNDSIWREIKRWKREQKPIDSWDIKSLTYMIHNWNPGTERMVQKNNFRNNGRKLYKFIKVFKKQI